MTNLAKFKYRMQNLLNIKEKLENQAKNDFAVARRMLDDELNKLENLQQRKEGYLKKGRELRSSAINIRELEENSYALERMDEYIFIQKGEVEKAERNLEKARVRLTEARQETKIQIRLREKAFEEFKKELSAAESKEVDELTSYTYGQRKNG